jgi:hypothetical protein
MPVQTSGECAVNIKASQFTALSQATRKLKRNYIGCSERRLIRHSFYRRSFLRKSCTTCQEKCRSTAPRTEESDKPAQWTPYINCLTDASNPSTAQKEQNESDFSAVLTQSRLSVGFVLNQVSFSDNWSICFLVDVPLKSSIRNIKQHGQFCFT